LLIPVTSPWAAEPANVHSLVIGIDDYQFERKLRGSVNDADMIARALRPVSRDTRVLVNGDAQRAKVLGAMEDVLSASRAGDTIIVTYSGHGARERVPVSATSPLGFRQFWVMSDFDRRSEEGKARRITSTEISAWLEKARAADVKVLLLADHCFAGTIYRGVGVDVANIRSIPLLISPDVRPDEKLPDMSEMEAAPPPAGITSLAADRADRSVSEFKIRTDGQMHGALSFAFAYAITRDLDAIDPNNDGRITRGALLNYLQRNVTSISDGAQEPQLRPSDPGDDVLFVVPPHAATATPTPSAHGAAEALPTVPMHVSGLSTQAARTIVEAIPGTVWAPDPGQASLIWQVAQGKPSRLVTGLNMIVSFDARREDLATAVQTLRISEALGRRATIAGVIRGRGIVVDKAPPEASAQGVKDGPPPPNTPSYLHLTLIAADLAKVENADTATEYKTRGITPNRGTNDRRIYFGGEKVVFRLNGLPGPNVVMVNLARDGMVQYVYPEPGALPVAWPASHFDIGEVPVQEPFGGDHMIVIASERSLASVERRLATLNGTRDPAAARTAIEDALAADPGARLAVLPVFTAPVELRCDPELIRGATALSACGR